MVFSLNFFDDDKIAVFERVDFSRLAVDDDRADPLVEDEISKKGDLVLTKGDSLLFH
jgi:hypothetical protein